MLRKGHGDLYKAPTKEKDPCPSVAAVIGTSIDTAQHFAVTLHQKQCPKSCKDILLFSWGDFSFLYDVYSIIQR